jgi:hypothetical protein
MFLRILSILYVLNAAACGAFSYLTNHGVISAHDQEIEVLLMFALMMLGIGLGAAIASKVGKTEKDRTNLALILMPIFLFAGWGAGIWLFPGA